MLQKFRIHTVLGMSSFSTCASFSLASAKPSAAVYYASSSGKFFQTSILTSYSSHLVANKRFKADDVTVVREASRSDVHFGSEPSFHKGKGGSMGGSFNRLFSVWQQGVVASIGMLMGLAGCLYFLFTPMKEDTVHHTAAMASEALQDANLQKRAVELSKIVVKDVLEDPQTLGLIVKLVSQLLARQDVQIAVSSLLQNLFEDRYTQEITKKFVLTLLRDRWVSDNLNELTKEQIHRLLQDEKVKQDFAKFLYNAASKTLQKREIHEEGAQAFRSTVLQIVNPLNFFSRSGSNTKEAEEVVVETAAAAKKK